MTDDFSVGPIPFDPADTVRKQLRSLCADAQDTAASVARGERGNALRRKPVRKYDGRGLHQFSLEVGRVLALRDLLAVVEPEWLDAHPFDPVDVRSDAWDEADRRFINEEGTR